MAMGPGSRVIPFGTGWRFGPAVEGSDLPGFDDSGWAAVTLPHTVVPLSWQDWDPAAWERVWVYRKHFDAWPETDVTGRRVFLDVGAALTHSTVTLNGTEVGDHLGGYLPFAVELTGLAEPSGNVLAVRLDSTFNLNVPPDRPAPAMTTSVDFWQPGGIYRDMRLRVVPQAFLADVFAKPVNVLDAAARQVVVQVTVDAAAALDEKAEVAVSLRDDEFVIAAGQVPVVISGPGQMTVTVMLSGLDEITLWDLDEPKLYHVVAALRVDGERWDEHRVRIGFREARFALDGFYLNGRRVKLLGVNRHQFFPFAGGAMPDRVQARDAEIIRRELNCTMVRCSHYPQSEAFFDACDELGLLAFQEAPGWGYLGDSSWLALASRDIGQMIVRDRNHPSIVIWGARLNETPNNTEFYAGTNDLAHALDDSRPTAGAMAGMRLTTDYEQDVFAENDYSSVVDSAGHKQPTLEPPVDGVGRPYLVTEAVGTLSGPARFYRRTDPQAVQQGQATAHARVHAIAAADDRYCGVLAWSGIDYPSGSGGNIYRGVKYTGVVDLFRVAKPGAAIYQAQLDPRVRPVIAPAFYWDFGPSSPVTSLPSAMICANTDRLEVYVGGSHFASVTPDRGDFGSLAYPPSFVDFRAVDGSLRPDLRIDGYLGPDLVASRTLASDPSFDRLALTCDDAEIRGDGVDATRVMFRAVDRYGAPRPYVTGQVTLSVEGPAMLIGDNPFDFGAAGGVGAVWIRSLPGRAGTVRVSASHPVLGDAVARLQIRLARVSLEVEVAMTTIQDTPRYATPVDYEAYGEYGPGRGFERGQSFQRPRYRFQGRITADGSSGYQAEPGRYHLYISWGCPWAQRTAIVRKLMGLEDVVSLSYVDDQRDGRGWAFRERRGPDPVNGFQFLAEAYEATEPGYDGHVSVPALWDRKTSRLVSNNFPDITIDLGTQFGRWADPAQDLYPAVLRTEIDALNKRVYQTVNNGTYLVAGATTEEDYQRLRQLLIGTFGDLDERLAGRRFLFGPGITEADVRLWPTLARFDLSYNPLGKISERRLTSYPYLWGYARDLYQHPAFRQTTDFGAFGKFAEGPKPSFVNDAPWRIAVEPVPADWDSPHRREAADGAGS